jgi:plasmid stabilization system protein ParE
VSGFTLTVRQGPRVARERHDSLEAAVEALSARVALLQDEEELPAVHALRSFEPHQRVRARLEISAGGLFRRREAGVDVMGDGRLVPYRGGIGRRHLDPPPGADYRDAIIEALRG